VRANPVHLVWYQTFVRDLGQLSPVFSTSRESEAAFVIVEAVCGARMHPNLSCIGGLAKDLPKGWDALVRDFLKYLPSPLIEYDKELLRNKNLQNTHPRSGSLHHRGGDRVGRHGSQPARLLPLVPMDFGLITHVFINLFSIAFKYSPPTQPVEIRGRILDDQLEVLVVDRGVGVPPEDLGRAFDRFYRVTENGSSNGLGLGLAICKAFIEAHGGRISLENNPMGGTIARFVIPAASAEHARHVGYEENH
jgi:signal transduction histidine kinase